MRRLTIILIFLGFIQHGNAQSISLTKADKLFNLYAYSEAVEIYEKHLQRDPDNEYLIQQTAYCYKKMKDYKKALHYYELHIKGNRANYEDLFQYGQLLLIDEQFEKATEIFNQCKAQNPNDPRPEAQIERIKSFGKFNRIEFADSIRNLSFNTRFSEMCPAFFNDSIAFVSSRDSTSNNLYSWDSQPFLDIFEFVKDKKGQYQPEKILGINTKYHEGPLIFTNNDTKVWFTRNNQNFAMMSGEETNNIRIYSANLEENKWKNVEEFQYNSDDYSVGHPAFSSTGDTMYFASSMPGSLGKTDLFMVKRVRETDKRGREILSWSEPENLGEQFNTEETEMFPFVGARGVIYFTSDGRNGFGGFDIYAAFPENNSYNIINLGQPINSTYDDFGFIISNDFKDGYYASNRPGGKGNDDIYYFKTKQQKLDIIVKSSIDQRIVPDAMVNYKLDDKEVSLGKTDANGMISMIFDADKNYYFQITHPYFSDQEDSILAFDYLKQPFHEKVIWLDRLSQLRISVFSEKSNSALDQVDINILHDSKEYESLISDKQGSAKTYLTLNGDYDITLSKDRFISQVKKINVAVVGEKDNDLKVFMASTLSELRIITRNEENNQVLEGVRINIALDSLKYDSLITDVQGMAQKTLFLSGNYSLTLSKDGFLSQNKTINIEKVGKMDYDLEIKMIPIYQGKTFELENLYYDLDSASIRPDAALVLDELYKTLIEFPAMEIELSSHTDCRNSNEYNMDLSQRRAQSAVNYLVAKGIVRSRMIAKGFGESKPVIACSSCDVCTDEQHQLNRRTEIKILKY